MNDEPILIECPCCSSKITVDRETGAILSHEEVRKREFATLDDAMEHVKEQREEARDRLSRAFVDEKNRDKILEKKFQEAMKKAADMDPDERPPSPFDDD